MTHFFIRRFITLSMSLLITATAIAQTTHKVKFDTRDKGEDVSIDDWGIDATWVNTYNAKASKRNAGDQIDYIRIGFYLHEKTNEDGSLSKGQIKKLNSALKFVHMVDKEMPIMLSPNNEEGIINWYKESDGSANVERWFNVMLKSKEYVESKGHKVISLEVFNEPDWAPWNMGKRADLVKLLRKTKKWDIMRVGPSTLSTASVNRWYDGIKTNVEAGSTHTLNGTMSEYIKFIKTSKRRRKIFMNPEVHALVEVIVGAEEGLDSACWWDQIHVGRAKFMKANQGKRLKYVVVERNWSAACVYRGPDDVLYGFASTNERTNGKPTNYEFICEDKDVTYYLNGDTKKGEFRKKGEPFLVKAKEKGKGKESITKWLTIVPQ